MNLCRSVSSPAEDLIVGEVLNPRRIRSSCGKVQQKSFSPVVLTANGKVQTNEEAQVYVHDLGLFVTVQLLEETPAVLSHRRLCKDHGYSYEWVSGQKPRLTTVLTNPAMSMLKTNCFQNWRETREQHRVRNYSFCI